MPRVPGGQGKQSFGIGLFVPGKPIITVPVFAVPARVGAWPETLQPPRINYSWAFQGPPPPMEDVPYGDNVQQLIPRAEWPRSLRTWLQSPLILAVAPPAEAVPARAVWLDIIQTTRVDYDYVQGSNFALLSAAEAPPIGASVQLLIPRIEYPRALRTWVQVQLKEEPMPIGQSVQTLVLRPEWPRSLRTWTQEPFYEEQAPVGETVQQLFRPPEYPRSLRTWLSTQIFEEGMPVGESVQRIAIGPEFLRSLRTWVQWAQLQDVVEQLPLGAAAQALVRWPPFGGLRFWSQGIANVLTEEPQPAGRTTQPLIARPEYPRGLRTWTWSQLFEEALPIGQSIQRIAARPRGDYWFAQQTNVSLFAELPPPVSGDWPKVLRFRREYGWAQSSNISLFSEVVEQPPVGGAVQALVRWVEFPKGLRSWTKSQTLEEGMPVGQSAFRRVPDPEFPRTLRSRTATQLFEEQIPPRPTTGWPRVTRPRADYNWVQATNALLLDAASVVTLPILNTWPLAARPEFPRSLRTWTSRQIYEERMPIGKSVSQRLRDPEFLRSLRAWSRNAPYEERMPVGEQIFRRVPDPEFLRSLRGRTHSQLPLEVTAFDITVTPDFFIDDDLFFPPLVLQSAPEPTYTYPIGHSLKSDYGKRLARGRLISGARKGRFIRGTPKGSR